MSMEYRSIVLDLDTYGARASGKLHGDLLLGSCSSSVQTCTHHRLHGKRGNMSRSYKKIFTEVIMGVIGLLVVTMVTYHDATLMSGRVLLLHQPGLGLQRRDVRRTLSEPVIHQSSFAKKETYTGQHQSKTPCQEHM